MRTLLIALLLVAGWAAGDDVDNRRIVIGKDLCLNIEFASDSDGAPLVLWRCGEMDREHRMWRVNTDGSIQSMLHMKCIDTAQSDDESGRLEVWPCAKKALNQRFIFRPDGLIQSRAKGPAQCIQAESLEIKAALTLADCDPSDARQVFVVQGRGRRPTQGGCYCKYQWTFGKKTYTYPDNCANPGKMHDFEWCITEGEDCVGVDGQTEWDRCDSSADPNSSGMYVHGPGTVGVNSAKANVVKVDSTPKGTGCAFGGAGGRALMTRPARSRQGRAAERALLAGRVPLQEQLEREQPRVCVPQQLRRPGQPEGLPLLHDDRG